MAVVSFENFQFYARDFSFRRDQNFTLYLRRMKENAVLPRSEVHTAELEKCQAL
jgi:hypothetical protein